VARAAFPKGHLCLRIREVLGAVFTDAQFADLFPARGRPALSPGRLALVAVLQFVDDLSDQQAADAVRGRIEWKYALGLELTDPGFDASVLCEFRARLVEAGAELRIFEVLLAALKDAGLVKARGRQRTDSTHVLAAIAARNRLEMVGEMLRAALNALAKVAPEFTHALARPEWYARYGKPVEQYHLPKAEAERTAWAEQVGRDGIRVLKAIFAAGSPPELRALPAVERLRRTWVHHYWIDEGQARLRDVKDLPPASLRADAPYDADARYGTKGSVDWVGYRSHWTETCDDAAGDDGGAPPLPSIITDVTVTQATVTDVEATARIHHQLATRDLLPRQQWVDTGYTSGPLLVTSRTRHGIDLIGPVQMPAGWQSRQQTGFALADFHIDFDRQQVTCPRGAISTRWQVGPGATPMINVAFAIVDCRPCPFRASCTHRAHGVRELQFPSQPVYDAVGQRRAEQQDPDWKIRYGRRAGIEGAISQAVVCHGMRRCRYRGLAKTCLQQALGATAMNLVRLDAWLTDRRRSRTRTSHLMALAA
jgi:transposase